eukprot:757504-Hanusia_phi.AAC.1
MVRQVKQAIEDKTSLQCWFDVEGGISPGEDHLQKMELGVERCEVFVMFISDRYVKSINCRREIRRACQTHKYILTVFVPELFQEEERRSGWSGSKGEGWLKTLAEADGDVGGIRVRWDHLQSFPKTMDLTAARRPDGSVDVSELEELVAAVQARAYRGRVVFHEPLEEVEVFHEPLEEVEAPAAREASEQRRFEMAVALLQRQACPRAVSSLFRRPARPEEAEQRRQEETAYKGEVNLASFRAASPSTIRPSPSLETVVAGWAPQLQRAAGRPKGGSQRRAAARGRRRLTRSGPTA